MVDERSNSLSRNTWGQSFFVMCGFIILVTGVVKPPAVWKYESRLDDGQNQGIMPGLCAALILVRVVSPTGD